MAELRIHFKGAFTFFIKPSGVDVHIPRVSGHRYGAALGNVPDPSIVLTDQRHYTLQGVNRVPPDPKRHRFDPAINVAYNNLGLPSDLTMANHFVSFTMPLPDSIAPEDCACVVETTPRPLFRGRHAPNPEPGKFGTRQLFTFTAQDLSAVDFGFIGKLSGTEADISIIAESPDPTHHAGHNTEAFDAAVALVRGLDVTFVQDFNFKECACYGGASAKPEKGSVELNPPRTCAGLAMVDL